MGMWSGASHDPYNSAQPTRCCRPRSASRSACAIWIEARTVRTGSSPPGSQPGCRPRSAPATATSSLARARVGLHRCRRTRSRRRADRLIEQQTRIEGVLGRAAPHRRHSGAERRVELAWRAAAAHRPSRLSRIDGPTVAGSCTDSPRPGRDASGLSRCREQHQRPHRPSGEQRPRASQASVPNTVTRRALIGDLAHGRPRRGSARSR